MFNTLAPYRQSLVKIRDKLNAVPATKETNEILWDIDQLIEHIDNDTFDITGDRPK